MIITCPECDTKYRYEEARFGGAEIKQVKCTSCGHSFEVRNPLDEPSSATSIGKMFADSPGDFEPPVVDNEPEAPELPKLAPLPTDLRYSLAVIALKLKEVFGLEDINDLPISFDIGWYEQKAVAVLLALLHLGVKGIRLGPTLPAFISPNVLKVLVENFDIKPTGEVKEDVEAMMAGK